jgi:hypothetical protein
MTPLTPDEWWISYAGCFLALMLAVTFLAFSFLFGDDQLPRHVKAGLTVLVVASSAVDLIMVVRVRAIRIGALGLVGPGGAWAAVGEATPAIAASVRWLPVVPISSLGWVPTSTLAVAALLSPLSLRNQRTLDRRFNLILYESDRIKEEFVGSLRHRVDADRVIDDWLGVVGETGQLSAIRGWVRTGFGIEGADR